jgi:hypothetical protein
MIERHPEVADRFLVLDRQESFGDYARAHRDRLAEHYEEHGIIVLPCVPINFDLEFFQGLSFPAEWKKIGTANGIEAPLIERRGGRVGVNHEHPLLDLFKQVPLASYVQSQIASFNAQLRAGLRVLFPRYFSLNEANISWRLTETSREGLHLDVFNAGAAIGRKLKARHRLKIFINIDSEARTWRVSHDLPEVLIRGRSSLPNALPDDLNVVNNVIDKMGVLDGQPGHRVDYPPMSAVIVNAEVVAHEVVRGKRMVAGEFWCDEVDMLEPEKHSHRALAGWLSDSGYEIAPDASAIARAYADLPGSYERAGKQHRVKSTPP